MQKLLLFFLILIITGCSFAVPEEWLEPPALANPHRISTAAPFSYEYVAEPSPGIHMASEGGAVKVAALTTLTAEGLEIQSENGCLICHTDKSKMMVPKR